jgi:hypothetical protein
MVSNPHRQTCSSLALLQEGFYEPDSDVGLTVTLGGKLTFALELFMVRSQASLCFEQDTL